MPNRITAKIDLNKVLDQHLFNANSGARYLDIVLFPSKESRYGDTHFIVQGVSKAAREAGERGPIIGNAKEALEGYQADTTAPRPAPSRGPRPLPNDGAAFPAGEDSEDVSF